MMEHVDRHDGANRFGFGASPARGLAVAGAALLVGLVVMLIGFNGSSSEIAADQTADLSDTTEQTADTAPADTGDVGGDATGDAAAGSDEIDGGEAILPPVAIDSSSDTEPAEAVADPADVAVMVINSAAPKGTAARLTATLDAQGYNTLPPTNATRALASAVYYTEGFADEARQLAEILDVGSELAVPLDPTTPLLDDQQRAEVLVVATSVGPIS